MEFPLVVGISGASGAIYGVRLLEVLRASGIPTHLIISKSAALTLKEEADLAIEHVRKLATVTHSPSNSLSWSISTATFRGPISCTPGARFVVVPTSPGTRMAGIYLQTGRSTARIEMHAI